MSCPHALHGSPSTCSQCLGATVRHVSNVGGELRIDGAPLERPLDVETTKQQMRYAKRGARRPGR